MKTKSTIPFLAALALAVCCLLAQSAFSFPFTDAGNYPLGNLGFGVTNYNPETNLWTPMGTNNGTGTTDVQVTNFTLTYPGLLCPATNAFQFGDLGYTERVAIAPPVVTTNASNVVVTNAFNFNSGTIYYSYVFIITNLASATTNGGFCTAFTTVTGSAATQPTLGGARLYIRIDPANGLFAYQIGLGKNTTSPTNATWDTNDFIAGEGANPPSTNFVVASYTFGTNALMWINPPTNTFGTATPPPADLTNNSGAELTVGGGNQLESFYFRQGNSTVPYFVLSNLRIGTNWSDVTPSIVTNTPPPPPSPVPLSVVVSAGNAILSWTTNNSTGLRLQGTPSLLTGTNAWTNVTASTNVVGTNYTVSDPIGGENFYRLIYP